MFSTLTHNAHEFLEHPWEQVEPYYADLEARTLDSSSLETWLQDWSHLRRLVDERYARLQLASAQDTANTAAEKAYLHFLQQVYPHIQASEQKLRNKLLESGLSPQGMEIPIQKMRLEAALFRQENLKLFAAEHELGSAYNRITAAQTVLWQGEEVTLPRLRALLAGEERDQREQGWRSAAGRQLADRPQIDEIWIELLSIRRKIADQAGKPDYRSFRWQQLQRSDYSPQDSLQFHQAVEKAAVPAASRIYARLRQRLNVDALRPWDLEQDLYPVYIAGEKPVLPGKDLAYEVGRIFRKVDPRLGRCFEQMRSENLLDLESRKSKALGAFCTSFAMLRRPFIFMNAAGTNADLRTLLHEAGHAFHVFERSRLPYHHQWRTGMEFAEVASLAMELLAGDFLSEARGGFLPHRAALLFQIEHLEKIILFWPYMAVVDAFQHWAYTHSDLANDPEQCGRHWDELWQRFIPDVNWSGLDAARQTGWQRKLHIFRYPFYYIEYGIAQLAAVQIWENAANDRQGAVQAYLDSLSLGGARSLPDLYQAAGAQFSFAATDLVAAVGLLEEKIEQALIEI